MSVVTCMNPQNSDAENSVNSLALVNTCRLEDPMAEVKKVTDFFWLLIYKNFFVCLSMFYKCLNRSISPIIVLISQPILGHLD